jgi:predicted DCC family thiol-disulfide oxidoreductase YuxK
MRKRSTQNNKTGNSQAIILFDGHCNLCNGTVQFILKRDRAGYFSFAALQDVLPQPPEQNSQRTRDYSSVILLENGHIFTKSTAALRIAKKIRGPWPLLYIFMLVPKKLRDAIYNVIARNRKTWFGRSETCFAPIAAYKQRFIQDPAHLSLPDEIVD